MTRGQMNEWKQVTATKQEERLLKNFIWENIDSLTFLPILALMYFIKKDDRNPLKYMERGM